MVNALYVALFAAAAWLFPVAARGAPPARDQRPRQRRQSPTFAKVARPAGR